MPHLGTAWDAELGGEWACCAVPEEGPGLQEVKCHVQGHLGSLQLMGQEQPGPRALAGDPSQVQVWKPRAAPLLPQAPDAQREPQLGKAAPKDPVLAAQVYVVPLTQWKTLITGTGSMVIGCGTSHRGQPLAHTSPRQRKGAWHWD